MNAEPCRMHCSPPSMQPATQVSRLGNEGGTHVGFWDGFVLRLLQCRQNIPLLFGAIPRDGCRVHHGEEGGHHVCDSSLACPDGCVPVSPRLWKRTSEPRQDSFIVLCQRLLQQWDAALLQDVLPADTACEHPARRRREEVRCFVISALLLLADDL